MQATAAQAPAAQRRFTVASFVREVSPAIVERPETWTGWVRVTPQLAAQLLDTYNRKNRAVRTMRVTRYASDMRLGKWGETGETIIVGKDGIVYTGQHRLLAVIESGVAVVMLFVVGVAPACRYLVDLGLAKVLADFLAEDGVASATQVASAVTFKAKYDAKCLLDGVAAATITAEQKRADVLGRHPGLVNAVLECSKPLPGFGGLGLWGWLYYEFRQKDAALATEFVEQVLANDGLKKGTPAYALRRRLDEARTTRGSHLRPEYIVAIAIKAWNDTRRGERRDVIGWRSGEPFPEIE